MTRRRVHVRMGELAVSARPGDVLVAVGLGSGLGLALADPAVPVAGLAHVVLPAATAGGPAATGADRAVARLAGELRARGATAPAAVLVGGAQLFGSAGSIGARNAAAVREELRRAGIPVAAAATGGRRGRTVRVHVDGARVVVREAAGGERTLCAGLAAGTAAVMASGGLAA